MVDRGEKRLLHARNGLRREKDPDLIHFDIFTVRKTFGNST